MKSLIIALTLLLTFPTIAADTYKPKLKPYTPQNHFTSKQYFNWGGSIVKGVDNQYYLFYSRWPRKNSFYAWLTHSQIAVATSKNPHGPWTYKYTALQGRRGNNWDAITAHNPKIKKFGNKYYLYYISTNISPNLTEQQLIDTAKVGYSHKNWPSLRNNQRTGVAIADKITGPWKRLDKPIINPSPPLHTLTVNPAITQKPDGNYLLMIKADKEPKKGSRRIQAIATSKTPVGPFKIHPKPAIRDFDTEDASIWFDKSKKQYYAIYHAHTHFGMITSADGLTWKKAKQNLFSPKSFTAKAGKPFKAQRMERPSVYTNDQGIPQVFISSYRKGNDTGIFTIPMKQPK